MTTETRTRPTDDQIRELCTIATRDDAGRHFTATSDHWPALEAAGLINVYRPVHAATGIPYSLEHWSLEVTDDGQALVDSREDLHPGAETIAEIIAAELDDDGQRYETDDGRKFLDLIAEHDGELTATRDGGRVARYHFPDGSAIVDAEVAWDLGYDGDDFRDCTCWPEALIGVTHYHECAMAEETTTA